jgi:demethylphylloquinol methyltransferase
MLLAQQVGNAGSVVGLDFAQNMLDYAYTREVKLASYKQGCRVHWVQGDALSLPFPDCEFDAITMGYGLRNVADIPKALSELHRVLKPGHWAAVLDFNHSTNQVVDSVQDFILTNLVVPAARDRGLTEQYEYLRPSILAFPVGEEQEQLARSAGFTSAEHYEIGFGNMGVLVVRK